MLSKKMQDALNKQLNLEYFSSYIYLAMAAQLESDNLPGFAQWMRAQSQEELEHAMKFFDFINERGGRVTLKAIGAPQAKWASPLAIFEAAYKHEQLVSASIDKLVDQAIKEADHASNAFLQWFVTEQVEEEANVSAIADKLKMVKGAPGGLFMMDRELGARQQA